jgi:hypothetical protein
VHDLFISVLIFKRHVLLQSYRPEVLCARESQSLNESHRPSNLRRCNKCTKIAIPNQRSASWSYRPQSPLETKKMMRKGCDTSNRARGGGANRKQYLDLRWVISIPPQHLLVTLGAAWASTGVCLKWRCSNQTFKRYKLETNQSEQSCLFNLYPFDNSSPLFLRLWKCHALLIPVPLQDQ